mmetsp:Transcript_41/g.119  ORF Transcript_41/g.119 Transcript_41/m.119 type:complete len:343 (+) Transcript_41:98-1126(+)
MVRGNPGERLTQRRLRRKGHFRCNSCARAALDHCWPPDFRREWGVRAAHCVLVRLEREASTERVTNQAAELPGPLATAELPVADVLSVANSRDVLPTALKQRRRFFAQRLAAHKVKDNVKLVRRRELLAQTRLAVVDHLAGAHAAAHIGIVAGADRRDMALILAQHLQHHAPESARGAQHEAPARVASKAVGRDPHHVRTHKDAHRHRCGIHKGDGLLFNETHITLRCQRLLGPRARLVLHRLLNSHHAVAHLDLCALRSYSQYRARIVAATHQRRLRGGRASVEKPTAGCGVLADGNVIHVHGSRLDANEHLALDGWRRRWHVAQLDAVGHRALGAPLGDV